MFFHKKANWLRLFKASNKKRNWWYLVNWSSKFVWLMKLILLWLNHKFSWPLKVLKRYKYKVEHNSNLLRLGQGTLVRYNPIKSFVFVIITPAAFTWCHEGARQFFKLKLYLSAALHPQEISSFIPSKIVWRSMLVSFSVY